MVTNAALQKMLPTLQSTQPEGLLTKKFEMEYIVWKKAQFTRNFFEFNFKFQGITTTDKMIQCITTQYLVQHLAIMLSVIMLSVVMLSVKILSVILLSVFMLSVVKLTVVMLSASALSGDMLSVVMLSVYILSVFMLSIITPRIMVVRMD